MSNVVQFRRRPSYAVGVASLPYLVEAQSRLNSLCDQYIDNNRAQLGPKLRVVGAGEWTFAYLNNSFK